MSNSYYIKKNNAWFEVFRDGGKWWYWKRNPNMLSDIRSPIGAAPLPSAPTQPTSPPQLYGDNDTDEKYVNGKFVDLVIHDDYVVLCKHKIMREKWATPEAWRADWEMMRERLAARGSLRDPRLYGCGDFEAFQRMIEQG